MLRQCVCAIATAIIGLGQSPDVFFRTGGATFRDTPPEARLYWQPHIQHSYRRILQAANLAKGKAVATILGSGVALEIPLAELARRFDRLILVDMDGASVLESLEQVPLELRPKVELRIMDITSFATALMLRVGDAIEASTSANEAFRRLDGIFGSLNPGSPVALPPSDLVVSSLVLSEIPRFPLAYLDRLMRTRFGVSADAWTGFDKSFEKLVSLAVQDHFRLLSSLCRPDGAVYYSDTVARGPAYGRLSTAARAAVEGAVLSDFRRLGLANSVNEVSLAVGRLCELERPVQIEIEAYDRLLTAYREAGDSALEPLLSVQAVRRGFEQRGLSVHGQPESWWWLSYPCAIADGPGAFWVNSWILRRSQF